MSIVVTISGGFGSGKSSVVHLACQLLDDLDLAIPYTTRPHMVDKRDSDFFFTSREVFELMIEREEFLEYTSAFGNYYGTPRQSLQQAKEKGKDLLIQVDDRGVAQIKQKVPDAVSILLLPGQFAGDEHIAGSTIDKKVLSRLQAASPPSQMPNYDKYDHLIVNDRLEDSANKVIEIIRSERLRRS